jgi:hypothetical protein
MPTWRPSGPHSRETDVWNRNATVGDLRRLHEANKGKPFVSSLDWIALGTFQDKGQPDNTPLFPRSADKKTEGTEEENA